MTTTSIASILQSIATSAASKPSFSSSAKAPFSTLPVRIRDYPYRNSELRFPLSPRGVKALIAQARPAKFGWRELTLKDRSVRSCWEIAKSKISLDKRLWSAELEPVLEDIRARLNLPPTCRLTAHLHNLLIYEPGDFFVTHQDTEKHDAMVATLIVNLPSEHRGGMLEVQHDGQTKRFLSSRAPKDRFAFFAFYADCHHQVKPVTHGYRVTLTFNLVMGEASQARGSSSVTTHHCDLDETKLSKLRAALRDWRQHSEGQAGTEPARLAYLLDHEYSQKNLSWQGLKNNDRIRAQCLQQVAEELGLVVHLTLLDVQKIWSAYPKYESSWYGDSWYRPARSSQSQDEDSEYSVEELIDEVTTAVHWLDAEGKVQSFANCYFRDREICWTTATDQFKPHQEQYEGYMGNYGNTLEYWYHRAAIVLWPREQHLAILFKLDANAALQDLLRLVRAQPGRHERLETLRPLLPCLLDSIRHFRKFKPLLELAQSVQADDIALTILGPLGWSALTPVTAKTFSSLCGQYGPSWTQKLLQLWSDKKTIQLYRADHNPGMNLKLVAAVVGKLVSPAANNQELAQTVVRWHLDAEMARHQQLNRTLEGQALRAGAAERAQEIFYLLDACRVIGDRQLHHHLLQQLKSLPTFYLPINLIGVLGKAYERLGEEAFFDWQYAEFATWLSVYIEDYLQKNVREADNWRIAERSLCNCADCRDLNVFLASSIQKNMVWPLAKARRQHIHYKIDLLGVPVTHETRRDGSPHKLILTKTAELFQRHQQEAAKLAEGLKTLRQLTQGNRQAGKQVQF